MLKGKASEYYYKLLVQPGETTLQGIYESIQQYFETLERY
ncbi:hypothetical protein Vi05172_g9143 [Venturia inaequalis]|nr:hypothetical protein Vi05172_g9143 [Venturia inaequalis]